MGIAAYNRGSRAVSRQLADLRIHAGRRADRAAENDHNAQPRSRIASLERDLARARRCIAELRRSKAARIADLQTALSSTEAAVRILTRLAFPPAP